MPKKKPQPVPVDLFEKLLAKAPNLSWRLFLLCGWWAGLRLSEAYELRWTESEEWPWVDFAGNRFVLPAGFAKSSVDQSVPMHQTLVQILTTLPREHGDRVFMFYSKRDGRPLTRSGLSQSVTDLARKAGVKLGMHKLRKGFGCRVAKILGKSGAPILHELMRHSSMQITMDFYVGVENQTLQNAIDELE